MGTLVSCCTSVKRCIGKDEDLINSRGATRGCCGCDFHSYKICTGLTSHAV